MLVNAAKFLSPDEGIVCLVTGTHWLHSAITLINELPWTLDMCLVFLLQLFISQI